MKTNSEWQQSDAVVFKKCKKRKIIQTNADVAVDKAENLYIFCQLWKLQYERVYKDCQMKLSENSRFF